MQNDERKNIFRKIIRNISVGLSVLLISAIAYHVSVRVQSDKADYMMLAFLDVGQGDAIYVRSPEGIDALIDGGSGRKILTALNDVMSFHDKTIDFVFATHPDQDHIGGLDEVLYRYKIKHFIDSGSTSNTQTFRNLLEARQSERGLENIEARGGQEYILGSSTTMYVLYPNDPPDFSIRDTNDSSIVILLNHRLNKILLTGDASQKVEKLLITKYSTSTRNILDIDILKLGHHGSKTSSSESFLRATSPSLAIISAGKNNRYGHPHPSVIGRLQDLGIPYINTAENGHIIFHCRETCIRQ